MVDASESRDAIEQVVRNNNSFAFNLTDCELQL